ncbi:hypothetical protein GOP47_0017559 [Adiantum capillus-veneris]|uniref:Uncharacterized protein n=1 Tax=Adiantum capillus-veneris TaxID=13818 RepID=A0A9D4ZBW6_ADICA|nr:hypothetical protein GOP47_0017559 [Adiantum capillus-veneris]
MTQMPTTFSNHLAAPRPRICAHIHPAQEHRKFFYPGCQPQGRRHLCRQARATWMYRQGCQARKFRRYSCLAYQHLGRQKQGF